MFFSSASRHSSQARRVAMPLPAPPWNFETTIVGRLADRGVIGNSLQGVMQSSIPALPSPGRIVSERSRVTRSFSFVLLGIMRVNHSLYALEALASVAIVSVFLMVSLQLQPMMDTHYIVQLLVITFVRAFIVIISHLYYIYDEAPAPIVQGPPACVRGIACPSCSITVLAWYIVVLILQSPLHANDPLWKSEGRTNDPRWKFEKLTLLLIISAWLVASDFRFAFLSFVAFCQRNHHGADIASVSQAGALPSLLTSVQADHGKARLSALESKTFVFTRHSDEHNSQVDGSLTLAPEAACCICLQEYNDGDMIAELLCWHNFHSECVLRWLQSGGQACPMRCKSPQSVGYAMESFQDNASHIASFETASRSVAELELSSNWHEEALV